MLWSYEVAFISLYVKNDSFFAIETSTSQCYYTMKLHKRFVKMGHSYHCGYLCLVEESGESLGLQGHLGGGRGEVLYG